MRLVGTVGVFFFLLWLGSSVVAKANPDVDAAEDPTFLEYNNAGEIRDPFEKCNRVMFSVNTYFDGLFLKPVTLAYTKVVPVVYRGMVSRFLSNWLETFDVFNEVLQGHFIAALQGTARFAVNSIIGVFGLGDPATLLGLPHFRQDVGLTLARWGVPPGPFIVLPFFGMVTLRDTVNMVNFDHRFYPATTLSETERDRSFFFSVVDRRAQLLDAESVLDQSVVLDRYEYVRDAYAQYRAYLVQQRQYVEKILPPARSLAKAACYNRDFIADRVIGVLAPLRKNKTCCAPCFLAEEG